MRKWRILDRGELPEEGLRLIQYCCMKCKHEAILAVVGLPLAQIEENLVFDGRSTIPRKIECPYCRRRLEAA